MAVRPAVLFARRDSIYKTLDCDVWDEDRDALKWPGGAPVVVHPPCGHWGGLAQFCKAPISEKGLAFWAVHQVRMEGGVLEHPVTSRLFSASVPMNGGHLPRFGERDQFGGFIISIAQWWFGHRAEKWTKLYICGCEPKDLPIIPLKIGDAPCVIDTARGGGKGTPGYRPTVTKPEREHTPILLAEWLLAVARLCHPPAHPTNQQ